MGAQEKADGHAAENSEILYSLLKKQFALDSVQSLGSSLTKTDILGINASGTTRFSLKFASGKNTQVWLPTLRSMISHIPTLA